MIRFYYYLDVFGVGGEVGGVPLQIKRLNNDAVCSSSISNSTQEVTQTLFMTSP